ncbi:TPA: hypothetical protein ENG04_00265 [Candidatus Poribacteria bacterium]|nr:hypothetical protein [Candidatus Poribacteria bacterium]HEX28498.1 hypothetical protein [Candidatus Poribacteria bacterium]
MPDQWTAFISLSLIFLLPVRLNADKSPFRDIGFPNCERSTYKVREDGKTIISSHVISREIHGDRPVYVIRTDLMEMFLSCDDMRPIRINKRKDSGEGLEFSIIYKPKRVHFIYPGPKRNKVMKIPDDSYDLNTMLEVMRCYPFERDKIKFTLVTPDHVLKAYAKIKGLEKVNSPIGRVECYLIEGGIAGIMGRIIRTKFLFWIEREFPHRLIKFRDNEREITLVGYERP